MLIFVVSHDDASEAIAALEISKQKSTDNGIRFEHLRVSDTSPLFETQAFALIANRAQTFMDENYVGVITYSFFEKTKLKVNLEDELARAESTNADVVGLMNLSFFKSRKRTPVTFIESVGFQHGTYAWMSMQAILNALGYKNDQIVEAGGSAVPFMCNWWFARPSWMLRYALFVEKCIVFAAASESVQQYLSHDAYYMGSPKGLSTERLQAIFKKDRYDLTPFVFERMPPMFFALEGARVVRGSLNVPWLL